MPRRRAPATAGAGVLPASAKGDAVGWDDPWRWAASRSIIKRSDISASGSNPNTLVRKPGIARAAPRRRRCQRCYARHKIGIASGSNATGSGSNSNAIRAAVVSQLRR